MSAMKFAAVAACLVGASVASTDKAEETNLFYR